MASIVSFGPAAQANCEPPRRQYRLDEVSKSNKIIISKARENLSKLRSIRERLSGPWAEAGEKSSGAVATRSGQIGEIEDETIELHRILLAIEETVDNLLGI